jgi:hypothetical protein
MQVKTPEASNKQWIRKSTMAYLEGEQELNWIVGIIGGDVGYAREILGTLKNYGDPRRYQELCATLPPC